MGSNPPPSQPFLVDTSPPVDYSVPADLILGYFTVGEVIVLLVGGFFIVCALVALILACILRKIPSQKLLSNLGCCGSWLWSCKTMIEGLKPDEITPRPTLDHKVGIKVVQSTGDYLQTPEVGKAFTYEELTAATDGFSPSNLLGEGGFGTVYKGTIAGHLVAVKQLKIGGDQGEKEFRAEVEIISRVHHRHLVSLVGHCITHSQRLLVYKYVQNGTLYDALHCSSKPVMDWAMRMNIAVGAARGLAYLHEDCHPKIIHRDIKGSNILLDQQFEAQVADFGLAKLLSDDSESHVSTRVVGTFGYMAPEYAMSGKLTDKSDVYSFGVVLLELITGKRHVHHMAGDKLSLVEWARPLLTRALGTQDVDALADPKLMNNYDKKEMLRMVEVAATCVRNSAERRPKMAMVLCALDTRNADLQQGVAPGSSREYPGRDAHQDDYRRLVYSSASPESSIDYDLGV
ncbi:unnamed protein product [Calypogeia fissa]